ncbi:hypothetical protein A1351_06760 [Methylosinus sp. R-45379]|nr:hypothetical protein A1351_06760 [Methylosinus sp. R-45379]
MTDDEVRDQAERDGIELDDDEKGISSIDPALAERLLKKPPNCLRARWRVVLFRRPFIDALHQGGRRAEVQHRVFPRCRTAALFR